MARKGRPPQRLNGWRCGVDPEFIRLPLQFVLDHLHGETSLTTVKHLSAGLEASLTTGDTTRRRLLDALLHEALAPAEARERATE